ncbi:MAG TPA: DegV family protein [Aggregatilineaceae bacterium]|nr:DegV family protein [Aggregatilineaceae bacterium]
MAARTAIVTDSTCNLPPDLARERGIHVVPLYVVWGDESLRDGIDIHEQEFYARLRASKDIPKTSQATPQDFVLAFEQARAAANADEVVCAVVSSALSGTYASAILAQDMVDFPVQVIDTRQVSWALGHVTLAAADARDNGASADEIAAAARDAAARQQLVFTIDSLEHLKRGGRISSGKLFVGSALNIKPVLVVREGVIEAVENVRTRKRALQQLPKVAADVLDGRQVKRLSVLHADAEAEGRAVLEQAQQQFQPEEIMFAYATTVLGVHAGPGAVGLVVEWSA